MPNVQVFLTATRFVDAVVALRLARRQWHRLDAALVQVPVNQRTAAWLEAWEALHGLDHAIANATDSLLRIPDRKDHGSAAAQDR